MSVKKLIEVALPLDRINTESAREKSIRHGHPSTLHLWWARRPLAAARAVIWSSLVDDPSSHPELFPTEESQNAERKRLFKILEDLVVWENSNNEDVLKAARNEILRSTNGNPPALLDPFAGGGTIPLEAQRLGLEAHAHDLNPVAVMINKAMIEIPPKFSNMPPVNPDDSVSSSDNVWKGPKGISADVEYYAHILRKKAFEQIGHLYPNVRVPNEKGKEATVIAWIWARTVKCPNPVCGKEIPLVRTFDLTTKKGHEQHFEAYENNNKLQYIVKPGKSTMEGTVNRKGAKCLCCGATLNFGYIREKGKAGQIASKMVAIVAEQPRGRLYLSPDSEQELAANVNKPTDYPDALLPNNPRNFNTPIYGFESFADHFTNRQLVMLTTFCNLLKSISQIIEKDAISRGMRNDHISLEENGSGARAYGEAICVYLAFIIDKLTDYHSSICSWNPPRDGLRNTFGRQAIPMVWDYAEGNPFSNSSGCFNNMVEWVTKCINYLPAENRGEASQIDAQSDCGLRNVLVSTDPPYYDNIVYADLADYFYIWLRKSLGEIFPSIFKTIQVPKLEELVATQYRFGGSIEKARDFFERGMLTACTQLYKYSDEKYPLTIFYAYKQSENEINDSEDTKKSSTGWETMLTAILKAGFSITGTWPMSTERSARNVSIGTNALASSIVLVCRKRPEDALQTTRRNLVNTLRRELRPALKKLQESNIAPVDLAQSAIGPGMAVYSRYRRVLEADGSHMSVRSALQVINEEIDLYFNEQVGEMDSMSRFCIDLYTQSAFNDIKFGDADILARAKGTSVAAIASHNVVYAKAGIVHLLERTEIPETIDKDENCIWLLTQQLTQAMATGGVEACAKAVFTLFGSNAERAKDLAYRLYTIAEQKKWASEAYAYNALVVAWPDIQTRAAMLERETPQQIDLFEAGLIE